jgi:hypothetical protein
VAQAISAYSSPTGGNFCPKGTPFSMGHRADLATLLHETHAYVESQSGPNVEIARASQARTMQARIESFEGGASKEEATSLMEIIRDGPWSPIQINNLQPGHQQGSHTQRKRRD